MTFGRDLSILAHKEPLHFFQLNNILLYICTVFYLAIFYLTVFK